MAESEAGKIERERDILRGLGCDCPVCGRVVSKAVCQGCILAWIEKDGPPATDAELDWWQGIIGSDEKRFREKVKAENPGCPEDTIKKMLDMRSHVLACGFDPSAGVSHSIMALVRAYVELSWLSCGMEAILALRGTASFAKTMGSHTRDFLGRVLTVFAAGALMQPGECKEQGKAWLN